jgi:hypothetical protein
MVTEHYSTEDQSYPFSIVYVLRSRIVMKRKDKSCNRGILQYAECFKKFTLV